MDKLAQKFNAQEMIKANSHAEAEEMKRLQHQVAEYEKILQEMRKLNYKNAELSEKIELMIGDNAVKLREMKEDEQRLIAALRDLTEEQTRNREAELGRMEEERLEKERAEEVRKESDITAFAELLEDKFQRSDDFVHKENVKVYRNVQAVVVDEIKRVTEQSRNDKKELKEELTEELKTEIKNRLKDGLDAKINKLMIFSAISMIASAISVILWALMVSGVFK